MNPGFFGSLTRCKHVRIFSEGLTLLSVLLGFLNLPGLSLNKAQLSLCLDINSDLVVECCVPLHWLFVISLTRLTRTVTLRLLLSDVEPPSTEGMMI